MNKELAKTIDIDLDTIVRTIVDAINGAMGQNRQTIKSFVVDAMAERMKDIDPNRVITKNLFDSIAKDTFYAALIDTLDFLKTESVKVIPSDS